MPRRQQPLLKIRPTYRDHTEDQYRESIRAAMPEGSILFDYFAKIKYDDVEGSSEFQRGMAEGMRRLAGNLLDIVMEKPLRVETDNEETD